MWKGLEDEDEDVSSYWMTLSEREDLEFGRGSKGSDFRELALEGAMNLSPDRQQNEVYEGVCVWGGGEGAGVFWIQYP